MSGKGEGLTVEKNGRGRGRGEGGKIRVFWLCECVVVVKRGGKTFNLRLKRIHWPAPVNYVSAHSAHRDPSTLENRIKLKPVRETFAKCLFYV